VSDEPKKDADGVGEPGPDPPGDKAHPSGTFDPLEFGREILGDGEDAALPLEEPKRPSRPTLSDEAELEAARLASMGDGPRGTALSLANLQAPSVPPAPSSSVPVLTEELSDLDRGWDDESPTVPRQVEPPPTLARPDDPPVTKPRPAGSEEASFADLNSEEADDAGRPTLPGEVPQSLVDKSHPSEPRPASGDEHDADAQADAPPETPAARTDGPPSAIEMADRVALGDYTGALEIAEKLLELDPEHGEALRVAEEARETLLAMYTARIGDLEGVPVVAVARDELRWLSIDHRAGFVLSLIDGVSTLEMVLDVSGMPRFDALRILHELLQKRIVSLR
jgi:hypothetical protein